MHSSNSQKNAPLSTSVEHQFLGDFKNRLLITPVEAGACVGWAKQTVYNKLNDEGFPIPLVKFNGRRMVRIIDLVQYVDGLEPDAPTPIKQSRRPGRPTKAESIHSKLEKKGDAA